VRRFGALLVVALALAGCGGSSHNTPPPTAQEKIKSAYQQFFSGKTSIPDRVAVLQNGSKFKGLVTSFASNPLAKNVSVAVSKVMLQGQDNAKVVYTVKFGNASLPTQTGTAVLQDGTWKVGYLGLCKLVALAGTTPSVCKS
jgi:hypothetical protein